MSQDGANLPQDVQGSDDHTTNTTASTPAGSMKTENSNSSTTSVKFSENNSESKPASLVESAKTENSSSSCNSDKSGKNNTGLKPDNPKMVDMNIEIGGKGENDINDKEGEGRECGKDSDSGGSSWSKSKNSSDVDSHEQKDVNFSDGDAHDQKDVVVNTDEGGSIDGDDKSIEDLDHDLHIWTERERRKKMKNMFSSLHALLPQLPKKADKASVVGEAINYITALQGTIDKLEKIKLERMRAQQLQAAGGGSGCGETSTTAAPPPRPALAVPPRTREAVLADMVHAWNAQADQAIAKAKAGAGAGASAGADAAVPAPQPFLTWSGKNATLSVSGSDAFITLAVPRQPSFFTKVLFVLEKHGIDVLTASVNAEQSRKLFNLHVRLRQVTGASSQSSESDPDPTPEDKYKLAVSEVMITISKD